MQDTSQSRPRALIVGSGRFDTVADSYRRALRHHYDVRLIDACESPAVANAVRLGLPPSVVRFVVGSASTALLRDPYALAFPGLIGFAERFAPDVILITTPDLIPPKVVSALRRGNRAAKVLGVFSDAISNMGRGYFFGADYDALFFKDHYIVDKFRAKLGWKHVFYLPQACDPEIHRAFDLTEEDRKRYTCDIAIAGNLHYFRAVQMGALVNHDIRIYGGAPSRWLDHPIVKAHFGSEVTGETKCRAMRAARIVLNNNHYAEISGTNKRTFEVAAMGAFQLTDTPALADVFVPNVEVATFDTLTDLTEKVDYYLAHPEERAKMAGRAEVRAHREHTYAHRWTAKLITVGMSVPAAFAVQPNSVVVFAT